MVKAGPRWNQLITLGVDSLSILVNHRSFQTPDPFPSVANGFLERRIPGKNGKDHCHNSWVLVLLADL